jgi:hypothetical protein
MTFINISWTNEHIVELLYSATARPDDGQK